MDHQRSKSIVQDKSPSNSELHHGDSHGNRGN
jgi:hypothetical protein